MFEKISELLAQRTAANDFPSAVCLIGEGNTVVYHKAFGKAVVTPREIPARISTIYDLASLTKVLVTSFLTAKLIEAKELRLSDEVSKLFKQVPENITVKNLLTHTSGFPAWKPFYLFVEDAPREDLKHKVFREICRTERLPQPHKVVYSDLNFLLLTFLIEKIFNQTIDKVAEKEIFAPLNLQKTFYNPPQNLLEEVAASELGNEFEKQTCIEQGFDTTNYKWRDYQIWGAVHDGNCFFLKGISGHAGLFSTAEETFQIARQFLPDQTTLLAPETCFLFQENLTKYLNEARSLGFQLAETPDSTAGKSLAPNSFGHLGFTGTSLWIEPSTERVFILLTNRTHHKSLPFTNINSVRRTFHTLAADDLSANRTTFE